MSVPKSVLDRLMVTDHPDLAAHLSRDTDWLEHLTDDLRPADWCLEWTDTVTVESGLGLRTLETGPDVETSHEPRYTFGTFDELPAALDKLYARPERAAGQPIELDINEWSLHYLGRAAA